MQRVFIGSSEEGRKFAKVVKEVVNQNPLFSACPWWAEGAFESNHSFLDSLFQILDRVSYAILVATPDDKTFKRGVKTFEPRDNVTFEYGLFAGRNSRERVGLIRVGDAETMSDLHGIKAYDVPCSDMRLRRPVRQALERATAECLRKFLRPICELELLMADLCDRIPSLKPAQRVKLLEQAATLRRAGVAAPADLDPQRIEELIGKYLRPAREVGTTRRTKVPYFVDLKEMPAESLDTLASAAAGSINRRIQEKRLRPTRIGLYLGADNDLTRRIAFHLRLPVVAVDHLPEESAQQVRGVVFEGEQIIFLHDILVQAETPVKCMKVLQRRHAKVRFLFSFAERRLGEARPRDTIERNHFHYEPFCLLDSENERPKVILGNGEGKARPHSRP